MLETDHLAVQSRKDATLQAKRMRTKMSLNTVKPELVFGNDLDLGLKVLIFV